jgi:16S rRNA (guanine527-N7)-methyltransferase
MRDEQRTMSESGVPASFLAAGAAALGVPLTEAQLAQFQQYYATLLDWNARMNLTAITAERAVQVRHFLDSLTVAVALLRWEQATSQPSFGYPAVFAAGGAGLADLGAGAGFPGVPLKILWPQMPLLLVESVGKKAQFLQHLAGVLGLRDVAVITGRAEALGQDKRHRGRYDVVTARAVAALPVLAEYGLPLCRVGGVVLAPKKGDLAAETAQAERATPLLGGGPVLPLGFTLPDETEERTVFALPKVRPTPPGYPRRVGLPSQRPLGAAPDC